MISIDLPATLEKRFWKVVRDSYDGDLETAMTAFLKLDSGKFSPSYMRDQVMYTGRLLDFSRRSSKVRQFGTLPADEKNSARTTL